MKLLFATALLFLSLLSFGQDGDFKLVKHTKDFYLFQNRNTGAYDTVDLYNLRVFPELLKKTALISVDRSNQVMPQLIRQGAAQLINEGTAIPSLASDQRHAKKFKMGIWGDDSMLVVHANTRNTRLTTNAHNKANSAIQKSEPVAQTTPPSAVPTPPVQITPVVIQAKNTSVKPSPAATTQKDTTSLGDPNAVQDATEDSSASQEPSWLSQRFADMKALLSAISFTDFIAIGLLAALFLWAYRNNRYQQDESL